MKRLLKATPNEIQSGIYLGVNKSVVPLWEDGQNVAFRDFGVKRVDGSELQTTLSEVGTPRDLEQAFVAGVPRIFVGTDEGISLAERIGVSWSSNQIYTWPTPSQFADLETWGTWIVGSNGQDPIAVWKNTGVGAPLAGTTFTHAKVLKRKSPYLFAMNTSNGEDRVEWCTDSNIEEWALTADNSAGFVNLRDIDSGIVAAEEIGDYISIYSRNSLYLATFSGGQNIWAFRRALGGVGAVSRRSIVRVDPLNYGLTENGIFRTDGNSFAFIDDPMVSSWLLKRIDWALRSQIWGFHDSRLKRASWHFPVLGSMGGGQDSIHYHYEGNFFTRGDLVLAGGDTQEVLEYPVTITQDGKIGLWQKSLQHYGADIPWYIRSKPIDFGSNDISKTLEMLLMDGVWDTSTGLRVWTLEHPEDASPILFHDKPLLRKNYFKDGGREAPFFRFEIYGAKPCTVNMIEGWGNAAGQAV